ncbi:MAG: type II toxin-antitoxin system YafQ family toxin [Verrucomicrobiia bacterium]
MRKIERATAFRRDYKREAKGRRGATLDRELVVVLAALAADAPLAARHRDHGLSGEWRGFREGHIRPDLLLIYRKDEDELLRLARLGTHSELFDD